VSATGTRASLFRDVGSITMDLGGVEVVDFAALGGSDGLRVDDLTGTGVTDVVADLAAGTGEPDLSPDTVLVKGTAGDDTIQLSGGIPAVSAIGLSASVTVLHADPTLDLLKIDTLTGVDTVDQSALTAGTIGVEVTP
jgi:hypothetical protein